MDRVDLAQPLGAVGDVDRVVQVVQEHADDFAEAQRHDGQVVAAQLERRRAQQRRRTGRPAPAPAGSRSRASMCSPSGNIALIREGVGQVRRGRAARTCRRRSRRRPRSPGPAGRRSRPRCSGPAPAARRAAPVSTMRTQALPSCCSSSGSAISADAQRSGRRRMFLLCSSWLGSSGAVRHAFAQQARGPQREHDDQHDEGEDVGVVAAQHAAGQRRPR